MNNGECGWINDNWQVVRQKLSTEKKEKNFWNTATFNKLRQSIFNKFKDCAGEDLENWESYKNLNNIKKAKPKKLKFSWDTAFYKEGVKKGDSFTSEIDFEHYDESSKLVIIKDPISGIGWDYDEPREGQWIGIPEKLAEKFIVMESFKNDK